MVIWVVNPAINWMGMGYISCVRHQEAEFSGGNMAKIFSVSCPNCGAALKIDINNIANTCPYCGSQLLFDDGNRTITINQNSYSEHHEYNEAKLRELEYQKQKEGRENAKRRKQNLAWLVAWLIIAPVSALVFTIGVFSSNDNLKGILICTSLIIMTLFIAIFASFIILRNNVTDVSYEEESHLFGLIHRQIEHRSTPHQKVMTVWGTAAIILVILVLFLLVFIFE